MQNKVRMLAAASLVAISWSAAAGSAQSQVRAGGSTLEEIVVTAQRREQNLQDVPITITTLTAATLANSGIRGTADLVQATPGLSISGFQHGSKIFLRGVGTPSIIPGDEPSVASYVDGVYMGSAYTAAMEFNNIARVEVLKGPQGTLFGRNAVGGLINVITKDPTPGFSGEVGVDYASYQTISTTAYVSGGNDTFAIDLAAYYVHQGKGWGHNLITGDEVNFKRERALRSKAVFKPTPEDKFTLILDWQQSRSDQGFTRTDLPGSIYSSGGPGRPATVYTGTIYDSISDVQATPDNINVRSRGISLRYQRDMDKIQLSVLSAYRLMRLNSKLDADTTPYPIVWFTQQYFDRAYQNEILLNGDFDRLTWTLGAFAYFDSTAQNPVSVANSTANFAKIDTTSYSGFAQATYDVTENTRITAGGRYTTDKRELNAERYLNVGGVPSNNKVGAPTLVVSGNSHTVTFNKFTYSLGIDHKLSEDVLIYLTQKRGFKSGDYNTSSPTQAPVAPEILDATELGLKSEFFDRQLRFNASGFFYRFKDIQLARQIFDPVLGIISQTTNAARAKIRGVDVDVTYAPQLDTGRLTIRVGAELLRAKYSSFPNGPISVPNGFPRGGNSTFPNLADPTPTDLSGNRVIQAPKFTGNLTVDYAIPVGQGELAFAFNLYRSSKFYFEPDNRLQQPAYSLLNGQVSYAFGPELAYRVRAFGRNLTDKAYYAGLQGGSFGDNVAPAPPRTIGVGIDAKF